MIEAIVGIAKECWLVFKEAAPFVLFGFFAAGLLKVLTYENDPSRTEGPLLHHINSYFDQISMMVLMCFLVTLSPLKLIDMIN